MTNLETTMLKMTRWAALGMAIAVLGLPAFGQEETTGTRIAEFLTIGGEIRPRYEFLEGFDLNKNTNDNNDMIFMRTRLNFDFDISDQIYAKIGLQDQRRFGDFIDGPGGVAGPNAPRLVVGSNSSNLRDVADIVLREGYVDFIDLWNAHWDVRIGRQGVVKGGERVFGDLDWHSFGGITHDAVKLTFRPWENQSWDVIVIAREENDNLPTGGAGSTAVGDQDAYVYGVYGDVDFEKFFTEFQPYYLYEDYDSVVVGRHVPQTQRPELLPLGSNSDDYQAHTFGILMAGDLGPRFDWEFEGNYQTGDFGTMDLKAHMLHGKIGFDIGWKHFRKIAGMYDVYSGDENPTDREVNTYQPLFPSFHEHVGRMGWFGMKNLRIARLAVTGDLVSDATWRFDWLHFRRDSGQDHFWENDGTRWFGGSSNFSNASANEFDFEVMWPWRENVEVLLSYSKLLPSSGMKQALGTSGRQPDNADNFIAQVTVKF